MGRLIGREADVRRALRAAEEGGVLLSGPAGVGKSRLAEEIADIAGASGAEVWRVYAGAVSGHLPLEALSPHLPADVWADGIAPALALRRVLDASESDVVVLVDDADALDDASAVALIAAADAEQVHIVATVRDGSRLPRAFEEATRRGRMSRIGLAGLRLAETREMAEMLTGYAIHMASATSLHELSRGNPLYVREVVHAALDADLFVEELGGHRIHESALSADRLADLVAHHLDALSAAARDALIWIAAAEPVGPGELATLVDLGAIEELERQGLVTSTLHRRRLEIRVAHPLHRETVLRGEPSLRVRQLRAAVAAKVADLGARRRDDRLRLAAWAVDGGLQVSTEILLDAGKVAMFASDHELAARVNRVAYEQDPSFETGWAYEGALYELGDIDALEAHYPDWEQHVSDPNQAARFAHSTAVGRFWRGGDGRAIDRLWAFAAEAENHEDRVMVEAVVASLLVSAGRIREALELAEPLAGGGPSRSLVHAALATGHGLRATGKPQQSKAAVEHAIELYRAVGEDALLVSDLVLAGGRSHAMIEAGAFSEGEQAALEGAERARLAGSYTAVGLSMSNIAWSYVLRGNYSDVAAVALDARRWLLAAEHPGMARWAICNTALAAAMSGDRAAARAALDDWEALGPHGAALFDAAAERALAWVEHLDGHPERAFQRLAAAAASDEAVGNIVGALGCWHDHARMGRADDALESVKRLAAGGFEGTYWPAVVQHIEALASGRTEHLGASADELVELGLDHLAAEAAEQAAAAAGREGDRSAASRWLQKAGELRERSGVARRSIAAEPVVPLTRREREVADLAARGVSSREIGERLFISTRTVDSHLARLYRKLGVSGRAELATVLGGPDDR